MIDLFLVNNCVSGNSQSQTLCNNSFAGDIAEVMRCNDNNNTDDCQIRKSTACCDLFSSGGVFLLLLFFVLRPVAHFTAALLRLCINCGVEWDDGILGILCVTTPNFFEGVGFYGPFILCPARRERTCRAGDAVLSF